ncbi:MAG: ABC transporter permease [Candidatus Caldarchaeum sp.]|nr:ABC transporter permease [Candidatus Caldarchaeum sp.]
MPISSYYLVKRIAQMAGALLGASFVSFFIFRVLPGDPVSLMVGPGVTEQYIAELRAYFKLDQPIIVQYLYWVADLFTLNLGKSFRYGVPTTELIFERLPATLELVFASLVVGIVLGVLTGVLASTRKRADLFLQGVTISGLAVPHFLWATILLVFFAALLRLFPASGRIGLDFEIQQITGFYLIDSIISGNIQAFVNALQHIALPAVSLAIGITALVQRTLRSSMLDVLGEDYILTDRMKGHSERYVIFVRALKNALMPVITLSGVQFTFLLGGSTVVEKIFGWPGMGNLLFTAVQYRDYTLVQGILMFYALIAITANFISDILYTYVNPKVELK